MHKLKHSFIFDMLILLMLLCNKNESLSLLSNMYLFFFGNTNIVPSSMPNVKLIINNLLIREGAITE